MAYFTATWIEPLGKQSGTFDLPDAAAVRDSIESGRPAVRELEVAPLDRAAPMPPQTAAAVLLRFDAMQAAWTAYRDELGDDEEPGSTEYHDHDDNMAAFADELAEQLRTLLEG